MDARGRELEYLKLCVQVAFLGYAAEWPEQDIRKWEWPITFWQSGKPFAGSEP